MVDKERKRARDAARYLANRERITAVRRERYRANRSAKAAYVKAHPEIQRRADRKRREKFPERIRARRLVNHEVECGSFPAANTMVCDLCDEALAAHWHHHNGYGPGHELDVIAVCIECHAAAHSEGQHA